MGTLVVVIILLFILSRVSILRGIIIVLAVAIIYVVVHRTEPGMQWAVSPLRSLGYYIIGLIKDAVK